MEHLKKYSQLGFKGEEWFAKSFPFAKWINKKGEQMLDHDFKIDNSYLKLFKKNKIDIKITKANSWTFNVPWSKSKEYFERDICYVLLYMDPTDNTIEIDRIKTGKEIIETEKVKPNKKRKSNCYISRINR